MAKTVIDEAKELIEKVGKEQAIEYFEERIIAIGQPKSFLDVCKISGNKTAIAYIKGEIKPKT